MAKRIPSSPRCRICYIPYKGIGGAFVRLTMGRRPSNLNPQLCNDCEQFAETYQGGAEVEMTILFADVRGSTNMAEHMDTTEYSRLINRFYKVTTNLLIDGNAFIEKLIGDEVTGIFLPGFSGPQHASAAVKTARKMLAATGHGVPNEPWVPVGIGLHTGTAYMGAVGQPGGVTDIVALGDAVNTAARITSMAATGEILISDSVRTAANLQTDNLEKRILNLKGRAEPVAVWVMSANTHSEQKAGVKK